MAFRMGRKRTNPERNRVEFIAEPGWIERATRAAKRLGFGSLSAMVRFAAHRYLEEVDPPPPEEEPKKGGRK